MSGNEIIPAGDHTYIARRIGKDEGDQIRAQIVRHLLARMVKGLRTELDAAAFINSGWLEVENFVDALCNGRPHPPLREWELKKSEKGRPSPSLGNSMRAARRCCCASPWNVQK